MQRCRLSSGQSPSKPKPGSGRNKLTTVLAAVREKQDVGMIDGFEEPYWNALQVLGWVYLGDRRFVRRSSDSVTDHGTFMQQLRLPDGRKEFVETRAVRPNLITLCATASRNGGAAYSGYGEARDAILSALQLGKLRAWGLKDGQGDLIEIPSFHWAGLTFYEDNRHRTYAAPIEHFRHGATHWHGLRFKRAEVLENWPDLMESPPPVRSVQPLTPLDDKKLDFKLKQDNWTLTEALFILHGYRPPGFETIDELISHFPDAYDLAVRSIQSNKLCREIQRAGEHVFIESPQHWFNWAIEKSLPVAGSVLARMAPADKTKAHGREWPTGTRSLKSLDEPLLERMRDILERSEVTSVWAAASRVAPDAAGGGTLESKQKRLARLYKLRLQDAQC